MNDMTLDLQPAEPVTDKDFDDKRREADDTSDCKLLSAGNALIDQARRTVTEALAEAEQQGCKDARFWREDESVILHDQPATAVYRNPEGSLVIRQERSWDRDEDTFVFITRQNSQTFLNAVCDALGVGSAGGK